MKISSNKKKCMKLIREMTEVDQSPEYMKVWRDNG